MTKITNASLIDRSTQDTSALPIPLLEVANSNGEGLVSHQAEH
jgi:hypothetical protein